VYALTRSGDHAHAESELRKLDPGHPLLVELAAFVRRHGGAGPDAGSEFEKGVDAAAGSKAEKPAAGVASAAGDFRANLEEASKAARSGNLARAEQLYQAVLATHPRNTEALAGLGDVARKRGDSARALQYYEQVLSQNPSYLPALAGAADVKWATGDRQGAVTLYKRLHDQAAPGTSYAKRAAERIKPAADSSVSAEPKEASKVPETEPVQTSDSAEPKQ
jgi:tetratricopeptide (TPR) repeat protein